MTHFYKLSGGGNDFIALAEPAAEPTGEQIAAWCRRGTSEGADGVFLLSRQDNAVRMRHFNADGGRTTLCLNGTRCAAQLAFELEWARHSIVVRTDAGSIPATRVDDTTIELELDAPASGTELLELEHGGDRWPAHHLVVGVPHLVLIWSRPMASAPVDTLGAALRRHPALGSDGSNVDFVAFPTPHTMEIRSFERGVEAETLACGTGVLASVAVGLSLELARLPVEALTRGGFRVGLRQAAGDGRWIMSGDARLLATGSLHPGSETLVEAPPW